MQKALFIILVFSIIACQSGQDQDKNALFELIPAKASGVDFVNTISTDDSINILNYEYLYNGGGVGIADFDLDGLPDLIFTGNQVPCRLYKNLGDFKFHNITQASDLNTLGAWVTGVSIVDINQDGLPDLYLCIGGMGNRDAFPNQLFINQGNFKFVEAAAEYGLADPGESVQATFFDYDRDGDLDMYLLTGGGFEKSAITIRPILQDGSGRNTDRLYRNDFDDKRGHPFFQNVSKEAGILHEGFGLGVAILDVNNDQWPDVYASNDYLSPDHLYLNQRNGSFREASAEYFKHSSHFAMGNDVGDLNNDGLPDLVAVDMLPPDHYRRQLMFSPNQYDRFQSALRFGYGHQHMRNTLQLHNGVNFSEIGQYAGIHQTDWSWGPLLADFDLDGWQDLFITNGYGKDVTDLDYVKFRRETAQLPDPVSRRKALIQSLTDRPAIKVPNVVFQNGGNCTFLQKNQSWGLAQSSLSNGAAYGDLDNDGDLDLVVNNLDQPAFVYRNRSLELDSTRHYLKIQLKGPEGNKAGIGCKVTLRYGQQQQVRWHYTTRGFQSTVESGLHFGLGKIQNLDRVEVLWPDGRLNIFTQVPGQQTLIIDYQKAQVLAVKTNPPPLLWHLDSLSASTFPFRHTEQEFNDFNYQSLLPHKFSQDGPGMTTGDVNGDGLEDVFVTGAYHQAGCFFVQTPQNGFVARPFSTEDDASEDLAALLFDADQDHDLDLYVVSGSSEYVQGHPRLEDRLYKNDGKGNFAKDAKALPSLREAGSCVAAADYDRDGDLDLFVGNRVVPGRYPLAPPQFLLENRGGKFVEKSAALAPELAQLGMVTSAQWLDYNGDQWPDLLLAGEAMPITLFENRKGKLVNVANKMGLKDSDGFWNSIQVADLDNDGDPDFIAGNLGSNNPYRASVAEPLSIHYADFDGNGSIDPLMGYFEEGICYPIPGLDALTQQIPSFKKSLLYYRDYAKASLEQVVKLSKNRDYQSWHCKTLRSTVFINQGNKGFLAKPLSWAAQLGPIQAILCKDLNGDENLDILAVGNSYAQEVVVGRHDALRGLVLLGNGRGDFKTMPNPQSGFYVDGDMQSLVEVKMGQKPCFLVGQNNGTLRAFQLNNKLHNF